VRIAVEEARTIASVQAGLQRLHALYEVRVDARALPAALQAAATIAPSSLASAAGAP
jgi:hypothetical protein